MPDSYTNVGPGAPAGDPGTGAPLQAASLYGGEPALAATKPMEMAAPIEPVIPTSNPGEIVHEEELPIQEKPGVAAALPLRDNVSPFVQPEPRVPATEYVPVTALEPVVLAPPPPPPKPVAKPAATPALQPAPPKLKPKSPTPAAVPQASPPRPAPVSAPAKKTAVSPPAPTPVPSAPAPTPPPTSQKELPSEPVQMPEPPKHGPTIDSLPENVPAPALSPSLPAPEPPSAAPVAMPLSDALQDTDLFAPAVPEAQTVPSVQTTPKTSYDASSPPLMLYSHNTRAVWHARRAGKVLNIIAIIGVLFILGGVIAYWMSIGSPTHVEDLPIVNSK